MKSGHSAICADPRPRRRQVRAAAEWNGLDFLEVGDDQQELAVFFLDKAPASLDGLRAENISIRPCGPGREVLVVSWRVCRQQDGERDDALHIRVDRPGGFSPYRLSLIEVDQEGRPTGRPLPGLDPRYAALEFSFKVGCPSELDCRDERRCPPEPRGEPEINYLAKDYAGFRQLMLDRLAVTLPDWRERHIPDLGIALVETLAYVGDHLSYYQDAVATEAYLDTARRRISVRRHARLVDYPMHEGCNARVFVHAATDTDLALAMDGFYCITGFAGAPPAGQPLSADDLRAIPDDHYLVFEPMPLEPRPGPAAPQIDLRAAHNEIRLYTWGDRECCLPRGATRATLRDAWRPAAPTPEEPADGERCEPPPLPPPDPERLLALRAGDLLLFEEVLGPRTGAAADADPSHRQVVRLTRVVCGVDELYGVPVLEVEWSREDALAFPLCISALGGEDCRYLDPVSVARGNVFLADHGGTRSEDLGEVPAAPGPARCAGEGRPAELPQLAGPYRPALAKAPLTFRQPLPPERRQRPASRLLEQDPRRALPLVELGLDPDRRGAFDLAPWSVRPDLLGSGPDGLHFVAELDDEGRAHLRFGDDEGGQAPQAGTAFRASYRVGNGPAGNIGAETIRHLVLRGPLPAGRFEPRNPLPARGGTAPEPLAEVRLLAPCTFRAELRRAIVADDYARLVERDFAGRVQRAAATLRWTGSWTEVLVAVDPLSAEENVPRLLAEIAAALRRYRRIGHEVAVERAAVVPLKVELQVCVAPHYLRGHVRAALLEALGAGTLADGRRGLFHPDNLTFGQGIALSRLLAAAQGVKGVESVAALAFERLFEGPNGELEQAFLPLGPLEIARLDNDPRFPDHGRLCLHLGGGR